MTYYEKDDTGREVKKSKQAATTTVRYSDGSEVVSKTTHQSHSEIVAVEKAIDANEFRYSKGSVTLAGGGVVPLDRFTTTEPHCGFCTLVLDCLDLPLGTPTAGNYNQACNFNYPLPARVRDDPYFYGKILGGGECDFGALRGFLSIFFDGDWLLFVDGVYYDGNGRKNIDAGYEGYVLSWADVMKKVGYKDIWSLICSSIFETNKDADAKRERKSKTK